MTVVPGVARLAAGEAAKLPAFVRRDLLVAGLLRGLRLTLLPHRGEGWPAKVERSRKAIRAARAPASDHREALEGQGEDVS